MASLTADLGNTTQVPDDIWYSRGVPPSKSMETLFSGVGNAIQGLAQTADTTIQKSITQKFDQFRDVQLGNVASMAGIPNNYGTTVNGSAYNPVQTPATSAPAGLAARGSGMGRAGGAPIFAPATPNADTTAPMGYTGQGYNGGSTLAQPAVPETTTISNTGQVGSPSPQVAANIQSNPILSDAKDRYQKMYTAMQQGQFSPALFWLSIDSYSKELRSMFPGYNQEINQMANDVFGYHTVAGHILSASEEQMRQNAAGGNADAQRATGLLERYGPSYLAAGGDPNILADAEANPNLGAARTIMATAMPWQGEKDKIDMAKNKLELQAAAGKVDQQDISHTYNMDASFQVRNLMKSAVVQAGGTKQNMQTFFNNTISQIGQGKGISDQTWQQLSSGITQLRVQAASKLADMQGDPNYSKLPPEEREKQNQLVLGGLDALEKAVTSKDTGMVATIANGLHLRDDQAMSKMLDDPLLNQAYMSGKINQGAAQMWGITNAKEIVAHVATVASTLAGEGVTSVDGALKSTFSNPDLSNADKSAIAQATINKQLDVISKGQMAPDKLKNWALTNFGQGNAGFAEYWSQLKPEGRAALYGQLSSPNVSKALAGLNDNQVNSTYQQWMVDQALTVPGVKSGLSQVQQYTGTDAANNFSYQYDPKTFRFNVLPPGNSNNPGYVNATGVDPTMQKGFAQQKQNQIQPLNNFLSNYASMLKAQGKDPNDPQVGIPALMQNMGLGAHAQPQGGDSRTPDQNQQQSQATPPADASTKDLLNYAAIDDPHQLRPMAAAASNALVQATGSMKAAEEAMTAHMGKNDLVDSGDIKDFLKTGGVSLDPHQLAWCAAMVSSALRQQGIEPPGTGVWAPDYKTWGRGVAPEAAQQGDVMVYNNGHHVGMFTGNSQVGPNGVPQYEIIAGNEFMQRQGHGPLRDQVGKVGTHWMTADQFQFRRANAPPNVPNATAADASS